MSAEVYIKRDWAPAYRLRTVSLASKQFRRSRDLAGETISPVMTRSETHHWDLYGTPAELLARVTQCDTEL